MIKPLLFILLLFILTSCFSQEFRKIISGTIVADSLSTEGIHIINITSKKATITNSLGQFEIYAQINDTLLFSAVQFKKQTLIITSSHIKNNRLVVKLSNTINLLNEVSLKRHYLSGNLNQDIQDLTLKNYVDEFTLNLPNAGKAPTTEVSRIRRKFNQFSGVVGSLYGWISGDKKKLKKIEKMAVEEYYIKQIRNFVKDSFFTNELSIKKENINRFLHFCNSNNIIDLYRANKKIELINVLIKQSKVFLENSNHEKK